MMKMRLNRAMALLPPMVLALVFAGAAPAAPVTTTLYHNPACQCCERYADYLNNKGYEVKVLDTDDVGAIHRKHGVPSELAACHIMLMEDYVVVGHIPEPVIAKLLRERPDIRGISLPGMPSGSPGMGGQKQGAFVIYTLQGDVYTEY